MPAGRQASEVRHVKQEAHMSRVLLSPPDSYVLTAGDKLIYLAYNKGAPGSCTSQRREYVLV